jgi:hypothetical protein
MTEGVKGPDGVEQNRCTTGQINHGTGVIEGNHTVLETRPEFAPALDKTPLIPPGDQHPQTAVGKTPGHQTTGKTRRTEQNQVEWAAHWNRRS